VRPILRDLLYAAFVYVDAFRGKNKIEMLFKACAK
jgi:hypothetical protein